MAHQFVSVCVYDFRACQEFYAFQNQFKFSVNSEPFYHFYVVKNKNRLRANANDTIASARAGPEIHRTRRRTATTAATTPPRYILIIHKFYFFKIRLKT